MKYLLPLILLIPMICSAKSPDQVRSAFLYQMAKFIEFPNQQTKNSTKFCFFNIDNGPGLILAGNRSLKIRNLPIEIIQIEKPKNLRELSGQCDITYIDESNEDDILAVWIKTNPLDTVFVGETIEFLEGGGIASLVQEGSKIRLYINKQQVSQHNFKVLSRLLAVSKFHPD
ncbi:YfiR family protein [Pseudoalteromonas sp. S16_S37]|uniref:YfiR family protein n=1 Tax=Pseudoalteromonas sp. S16_S37 TaxID=2720228 RepID=UPI0016817D09|nr:YfiR family protein [Pseudoalteromonas sp. S16_S37]MBD1584210.1 YfiR family protein [Pseudoalteromonas sp. S16_S37]